jgi:2-keto-4-pentenoate hydratase/2-oxohepta-3-ene-1,7-dioic acid hydratase in catechol pathway
MRFVTLLAGDRRFVAARRPDGLVDLAAIGQPDELGALLRSTTDFAALQALVTAAPAAALVDPASVRHAPPIAEGAKILCLGLNYTEHAREASYTKPEHPVVFSRFASSFVGHDEPLDLPSASVAFDYEAELVAVIGKGGRRIPIERALDHVAGYTLMNDGSVRDFQTRTHQWLLGKNFDRSGSIGPEIVTADELPPGGHALALRGRLDGETMQQASTSDMIFDVATTVAYLSVAFALSPGDLIAMGTPAGVGNARKPPVFLRAGSTFEVEVEGVGILRNSVRPEAL